MGAFESNDQGVELIDIPMDVEEVGDGYRLDRYLSLRFARLSRARIHKMIDDGRVLCRDSGRALAKKSLRVRKGQRLLIRRPPPPEPKSAPHFSVVYCDESLLVVDKPGDLAVHPSARYHHHTLTAALLARFGEGHGWEMAHRLDRETSGVMLFGQRGSTATQLKQAFFARQVDKEYVAIVHGHLPAPQVIDLPLGPAQDSKVLIKVGPLPCERGGLPAVTLVAPLVCGDYRGQPITLVQVWLLTGRTHQIRAHFEAIGYPVLGDKLYGGKESHFLSIVEDNRSPAEVADELGLARQALHAMRVSFVHPRTGKKMIVQAPWPAELSAVLPFACADLLPAYPAATEHIDGPCR